MAWTNAQKALLASACKADHIADEYRRLILAQCPGRRATHQGKVTSTSPRLGQGDFEFVMAIVERYAGGQLAVAGRDGTPRYAAGHWQAKADDQCQRMRHLAQRLAASLEERGLLQGDGVGLRGWIAKYLGDAQDVPLHRLGYAQLHTLINGLRAYARRHGLEAAA